VLAGYELYSNFCKGNLFKRHLTYKRKMTNISKQFVQYKSNVQKKKTEIHKDVECMYTEMHKG